MPRRLFALAAAMSLVICIAVGVLWVRSYFVGEIWHFPPTARTDTTTSPWRETDNWCFQHSLGSGSGRVQLVRREIREQEVVPAERAYTAPDQAVPDLSGGITRSDRWFNTLGFGYFKRDKQYAQTTLMRSTCWGFRVLTLPDWFLFAAAAALPALWTVRYAKRRRRLRTARQQCPR